MRFKCEPQLILTKEEFDILDNALKLCRDMDCATSYDSADYDEENEGMGGCNICPFRGQCSMCANVCVYAVAHHTLKKIIDVAVVK